MPRGISTGVQTETEKIATNTLFLVWMDFSTPVALSSREQIAWDSKTWLAADMRVSVGDNEPNITIFNEGTTLGTVFLAEGVAGRAVKIYQRYGTETPVLIFDGEMGQATINRYINVSCRQSQPRNVPNLIIGPPYFNYVPKKGLRIETSKGTITLGGR